MLVSRVIYYLLYHRFSVYLLTGAALLAFVANEQLIMLMPRIVSVAVELAGTKWGILKDGKGTVLHVWFGNGVIGTGAVSEVISLKDDFTLEAIVKPSTGQVPYAHIMGNHPGYNYYEGFAIQQDGNNQNVYTFGYGNGTQWLPGVRFELIPKKWSYLAIVVKKNMIKAFRDGILVASADAMDSIKNSGMPVSVGNWVNGDRPLKGLIYEVRVLDRPLTEKEICSNWQNVQEKLM